MDLIGLVQWPAMIVTIAAAWLIASTQRGRRNAGFWLFLLSNVLWVGVDPARRCAGADRTAGGPGDMNIRGALKTETAG